MNRNDPAEFAFICHTCRLIVLEGWPRIYVRPYLYCSEKCAATPQPTKESDHEDEAEAAD